MNSIMNKNNLIVRQNGDESCIKLDSINYCKISGAKRVVSQTFMSPANNSCSKIRKIIGNVANSLPEIAIKKGENGKSANYEILVNGCWDTSNKIPNIIAEMHNVTTADFQALQNVPLKNSNLMNDCREYTNPSPRGSDSGIESDCTEGNLSWLLNYKIHELPPVPDSSNVEQLYQPRIALEPQNKNNCNQSMVQIKNFKDVDKNPPSYYSKYPGLKKPPFTYTELIEHALNEKGELTVSGIYQWISDHFPFYKQNDDRWKNSVRHNLSINPHFRKGGKAVHGAGHLWTIAQRDEKKAWQIKQRMQQFIQTTLNDVQSMEAEAFDKELQTATESILGESFKDVNNQETNNLAGPGKENIEVEYINIVEPTGLEDFLAPPVSKQQIVQECGLGSDFFITDLNPNALGLNISEAIAEDGLYDDMSFEYYEMKE